MVTDALERLAASSDITATFYVDQEALPQLPAWVSQRMRHVGNVYPRRDRLAHALWEQWLLPAQVKRDQCTQFLSLYQSASCFPQNTHHVMVVHDLVPEHFPEYRRTLMQKLAWQGVKRAITQATRILCPSEFTAADCAARLSLPRERIDVVSLGVHPMFHHSRTSEEIKGTVERYGLAPRGYILHAGGLEVRKNTTRLLQAYAKLSSRGVTLPLLVIAGKLHAPSNALATPVAKLIAELGLGEKVRLLGFVPATDLPALIAGASCFAYPSLFEGFGLPVLEAMAVGTAVLTSCVTALPEVAGEAAAYCDPTSIGSIAEVLERLIQDEAWRRELSERGRVRARQFSWEGAGDSIVRQAFQIQSV